MRLVQPNKRRPTDGIFAVENRDTGTIDKKYGLFR